MRWRTERTALGRAGLLLLALGQGGARALTPAADRFRSGKVEWTRLVTTDPYWNRHSDGDRKLISLMRENTSLDVAGEWRAVGAGDLATLCGCPFVYAANIAVLKDPEAKNLAEYLKRGGFLFIDACVNPRINSDPKLFFTQQMNRLAAYLPGVRAVEFAPTDEIFSVYFLIEHRPPMTRQPDSWSADQDFPLRKLMVGDQMVGVVSLCGLQCAWTGFSADRENSFVEAMKMATNIYLYAMSR